eukprot:3934416-Rhodomonas_salina.1
MRGPDIAPGTRVSKKSLLALQRAALTLRLSEQLSKKSELLEEHRREVHAKRQQVSLSRRACCAMPDAEAALHRPRSGRTAGSGSRASGARRRLSLSSSRSNPSPVQSRAGAPIQVADAHHVSRHTRARGRCTGRGVWWTWRGMRCR